jgi:Caspase domain/TIR domain
MNSERATAPLNAHALVIQIAKYPRSPLPEVADATDLADVLRDPALCGYPPAQVQILHDHQATREAILGALQSLVATADADATVLFYFSGHGGQLDEVTYLLPIDTEFSKIATTALSAAEFARALALLRARKVLLIFDCCHSGGLEAKDVEPLRPGLPEAAHDALLQGRGGWALFASSDVDEASFVRAGERNGIFTKHFLAGLRGERPSEDGYVRVLDLYEYLQPRVSQEEPRQHPIFKCALRDNFAVARYRGGAIGHVARTDDGFLYHALLSYAQADAPFVRTTLLPRLRTAGLRVATANSVGEPDMDRVLGLERGLELARRTVVVVSPAYLRRDTTDDRYADHVVLQSKHADIASGRFSLVPIHLDDLETLANRPAWLASLVGIHFGAGSDRDPEDEMTRLLRTLASPVPRR